MHTILTISQTDPRPMYQQIVEQVQHHVSVGDLKPGQEMPSIRALAVDLRVSVITVKRAYFELERDGVIVSRQGRGTFIADDAEVGPSLQEQALDRHLAAALETAERIGTSTEQLCKRLRALAQSRRSSS